MLDLNRLSANQMITDIEKHHIADKNVANIDIDLICQPEGPNWPTVPPPPKRAMPI